jgi:hypothetical protein
MLLPHILQIHILHTDFPISSNFFFIFLELGLVIELSLDLELDSALDSALDLELDSALDLELDSALDLALESMDSVAEPESSLSVCPDEVSFFLEEEDELYVFAASPNTFL